MRTRQSSFGMKVMKVRVINSELCTYHRVGSDADTAALGNNYCIVVDPYTIFNFYARSSITRFDMNVAVKIIKGMAKHPCCNAPIEPFRAQSSARASWIEPSSQSATQTIQKGLLMIEHPPPPSAAFHASPSTTCRPSTRNSLSHKPLAHRPNQRYQPIANSI
jgi:hypothetical protein